MNHLNVDCELKFASDGTPEGTFSGYASVFGLLDQVGDIVERGAFKGTLAEWRKRKGMPSLLWQHRSDEPIGVWTAMEEDDKGLKVQGELIMEVGKAKEAYALMKRGAIKGLSIGYRTKDYELDRTTGVRKLKKVDLMEVSLVTSPALREAQISAVKASDIDPREFEHRLREAGVSRSNAVICVGVLRKMARCDVGSDDQGSRDANAAIAQELNRIAALFG
jgi:uncharacterized protein